MRACVASALALACSANAFAQTIPTPAQAAAEIIEVHDAGQPPNSLVDRDPLAASDTVIDARVLALRPHRRAEDLTQDVPGLFTVQHAGGGSGDAPN